jgi:hypothetical protein
MLFLFVFFSCSRVKPPSPSLPVEPVTPAPELAAPLAAEAVSEAAPVPEAAAEAAPDWPWPLALIKSGEHPLWFVLIDGVSETGLNGIRLRATPSDAALKEFVPWPVARNASALLLHDERLVLAINREGFLVAQGASKPQAADLALYRIADRA